MRTRHLILQFVCLLLLFSAADNQAQPRGLSLPVVVDEVVETALQKKLWFNANIISRNDTILSSENAGRVLKIAEVGDQFVAGQSVAKLDDSLLLRDLREQRAEVASRQSRINFLQKETERLQKLVDENNAALSKLEEVQSDLSAAASMKEAVQARVSRIQEIIRRMKIAAPFDGIVTQRMAELGEWVKEGSQLLEFVDLKNREIQAWLPFHVLSFVANKKQLAIKWRGQRLMTTVRAAIPVGSGKSRLFEIRLDADTVPAHIGELVQVEIPVEAERQVLIVPEDALVIRHDGITVFTVDKDMKARQVKIKTGLSDGSGKIEVMGTLQAGDKVVIRGGERLRSGMQVSLQKQTH